MRGLSILLLAITIMCPSISAHAVTVSQPTRIESVTIIDNLGVIRLEVLVSNPVSNPANCTDNTFVDIRLDDPNRSETEQRELLNIINLAFVTRRAVRLWLLDQNDPDNCSTAGTSNSIRVAVGIQAIY